MTLAFRSASVTIAGAAKPATCRPVQRWVQLPAMSHDTPHTQIILDGCTFDLDHLAPATLLCARPQEGQGRDLRLEVTFSHHTYTIKEPPPATVAWHQVVRRGDRRFFDVERWQQSREFLPGMIAGLPAARVEYTPEKRNYRHALGRLIAPGTEYALFFSLKRSQVQGFDLHMTVESAYPLPAGSRGRPPGHVRFAVLAHKVLLGQPISAPPRR